MYKVRFVEDLLGSGFLSRRWRNAAPYRYEKACRNFGRPCVLFNMGVVIDVVLAVAMVTLAPGAVAEFQLRIGHIRAAADGAFVGVGGFGRCHRCLVGTGVGEGDGFGFLRFLGSSPEEAPGVHPPGHGEYIGHILAEEQEVVGKGDDGEQVVGEWIHDQIEYHQEQVNQRKDPGFHRDDEQEQKLGVGIHGGVSQEQAEIQMIRVGASAEDHAVDIHKKDATEIEEVEPEGSPAVLYGPTQGVVAQKTNGGIENVAHIKGQRIADQTPDLALQDGCPVKAEEIVKGIGLVNDAHDINKSAAQCHIHHQIWNALIPVAETEPVKAAAKIFHELNS